MVRIGKWVGTYLQKRDNYVYFNFRVPPTKVAMPYLVRKSSLCCARSIVKQLQRSRKEVSSTDKWLQKGAPERVPNTSMLVSENGPLHLCIKMNVK